MADNVHITSSEAGAFEGAFDGLPPWATEDTTQKIEKILKDSLGIQNKTLAQLIKCCGTGKASNNEELEKSGKDLSKIFRDVTQESKKREKDTKKEHELSKKRWTKEAQIAALRTAMWVGLFKIAEKTKEALIDNVKTYDALYQSGIDMVSGMGATSSGFQSLQQLTVLTGVRFTELQAIIQKNSAAINAFGLDRFARTISSASIDLQQFGFSTKETASLLGDYLEVQRGFTETRALTEAQVIDDLKKFGERITKVSQATGMSRNQILAHMDAVSKNVDMMILSTQIGSAAAQQTSEFIASFKDQRIGQAMLRMMTDVIKPLNTTFMDFQKIGFGGFGQKLMNFTQSLQGLPADEANEQVAKFMNANRAQINAMTRQATLLRQVGSQEAASALQTLQGLEMQERTWKSISAEDREKARIAAAASAELRSAWEEFLAQFQKTFAPLPKMLKGFTWILEQINTGLDTVREWIGSVEGWINQFKIITDITGKIDLLPWIGVGLAGLTALAGIKIAFGAFRFAYSLLTGSVDLLWKGTKSVGKSVIDIGKFGASIGRAILTAGKFILSPISSIGKMIGKIGPMLMRFVGPLIGVIGRLAPMFIRFLGPIGLLYTAFQLGSAIGETIYEMLSQFEWFNNFTDSIFSGLETGWEAIKWAAGNMGEVFSYYGNLISEQLTDVGKWFSDAGDWTSKKLTEAGSWIGKKLTEAGDWTGKKLSEAGGWIINAMSPIGKKLSDAGGWIGKKFKDTTEVLKAGSDLLSGIFQNITDSISQSISPIVNIISSTFTKITSNIGSVFGKTINSIVDGVKNLKNALIEKFITIFSNIGNKFNEWFPWIGKVTNFIAGIVGTIGDFFTEMKLFGESFVDTLQQFLKTVLEKFIDKMIPDSLQFWKSSSNTDANKNVETASSSTKLATVSLPEMKRTSGVKSMSTPKPSELNSPSEVSTKADTSNDRPFEAKKSEPAPGAGIRKENPVDDINMVIGQQTNVLLQILQSTNSLVSVNQEILRYTKVNT